MPWDLLECVSPVSPCPFQDQLAPCPRQEEAAASDAKLNKARLQISAARAQTQRNSFGIATPAPTGKQNPAPWIRMELPRAAAASPEVSSKVNYALKMPLKHLPSLLPLHKHTCNIPTATKLDFLPLQLSREQQELHQ